VSSRSRSVDRNIWIALHYCNGLSIRTATSTLQFIDATFSRRSSFHLDRTERLRLKKGSDKFEPFGIIE
jgi:hypothetical protein